MSENRTGQDLYKKAKSLIPGGTMLLSKRPEMFLPEHWPSYYKKAKGCTIWDLDGNELTDVFVMGIGTNVLGYANDEVDQAVMSTVKSGNLSSLNCPEEVQLAEKLVEMHPWADMVRLARTGGEANSIGIRIARAAAGKDKVAVCGYHGWHDWYLSANLGDKENLSGHLLPGLDPAGVPQDLRGSVVSFTYNDYARLEEIVSAGDVGVIKMEVVRNFEPEDNFLHKVRKLATDNGIVLIFDECTSGFRETFGGIHKKYGVAPDMAIFGKTLGNGYAITAVIGKEDVMQAAQKTFISSTFWTERIGPTAAVKTLEVMEREKCWELVKQTSDKVKDQWESLAQKTGVDISVSGIPGIVSFGFNSDNNLAYKTFITQEMLKKGYLAGNSLFVSIAHTDEVLSRYLTELEEVFAKISSLEQEKIPQEQFLEGPVCHSGFKRLN